MSDEVIARVKAMITSGLTEPSIIDSGRDGTTKGLPTEQKRLIDDALAAADGARDALLIVLAYRLVLGHPIDPRYRLPGDRAVSDYLGRTLLPNLGIAGVKSALEGRSFSHGYLSTEVRRSVLRDTAPILADPGVSDDEIAAMFEALAMGIATTARVLRAASRLGPRSHDVPQRPGTGRIAPRPPAGSWWRGWVWYGWRP